MIGSLHFLKNEAFTSILFIKVSHKQNYNIGKKYNNPNQIGLYVVSKKSMFNQIQRCFKGLDNKNSLISIKIHHMLEIGLEYKPGKSYQKTKTLTMEYKKIKKITNYYSTNIYPRE